MYKHILLATDLSEISEEIALKAKALGDLFGSEMTLVHVVEPIPAYGYPGLTVLESPFIEDVKKQLKELGNKIGISESSQIVEVGSIKSQILHIADELDIDLIIVGSHGHHGIGKLLGSTASAVVRSANRDVITLWPNAEKQ